MRARIIGLAAVAAIALPAVFGQAAKASAASAEFWVTGYVLRGYTATGTYVHPGTCAVDPRIIPLGSYFTVSGIGTCHAEDTGGAIIGYRIDVWVSTVSEAYAITGWRTVTWGADQQVLGYSATVPRAPVYSAPRQLPAAQPYQPYAAVLWYRRTNSYAHQSASDLDATGSWYSQGNSYVHPATDGATSTTNQAGYVLSSIHAPGCSTNRPTTYSGGSTVTTRTTPCH